MELFILLAVIIGAVVIFKVLQSRGAFEVEQRPMTRMEMLAQKFPDVDLSLYQMRYRLMNNSESSFYYLLLKHLPEGFQVFPKMRIADIIKTKNGKGYYKQRNKILPKHVDFVVCDKNLSQFV